MSVVLIVSLCLLFTTIVLVIYRSYVYLKAREEETQTSDFLTNLLPFIKTETEGKEYSLI